MKTINAADATELALDWLVAKAEGLTPHVFTEKDCGQSAVRPLSRWRHRERVRAPVTTDTRSIVMRGSMKDTAPLRVCDKHGGEPVAQGGGVQMGSKWICWTCWKHKRNGEHGIQTRPRRKE